MPFTTVTAIIAMSGMLGVAVGGPGSVIGVVAIAALWAWVHDVKRDLEAERLAPQEAYQKLRNENARLTEKCASLDRQLTKSEERVRHLRAEKALSDDHPTQ